MLNLPFALLAPEKSKNIRVWATYSVAQSSYRTKIISDKEDKTQNATDTSRWHFGKPSLARVLLHLSLARDIIVYGQINRYWGRSATFCGRLPEHFLIVALFPSTVKDKTFRRLPYGKNF